MRVLFYIRSDYQHSLAGDSIQLLKTREFLTKKGLQIKISSNPQENLRDYSIVHLFNTIRVSDTYQFYKNARQQRKKIVLSPIYWNYIRYVAPQRESRRIALWNMSNPLRKEVLEGADLIFPGAESEMRAIEEDFNLKRSYVVIPNGVDGIFASNRESSFLKQHRLKDYVLTVARVCDHKNQLAVAKATRRLGVPYVIIGPINQMEYYYQCMKEYKHIIYVPKVEHEDLVGIYHGAKVHALVSWYEIPGLVNLEAGLAGCNVLTTTEGSTKDYFKDYVSYANPNSYSDIEKQLENSYNKKKNEAFRNYIEKNYLWERIAEKLLKAYQSL